MGLSAQLFFSSDVDKQTLHRRISPTDDQIDDQQVYWNDLADYLRPDLRERSGYPVTSWIQGSYKFATQIRPARKGLTYDIDLGVYFAWEGDADDGDHSASELKSMVQASLQAYATDGTTDGKRVSPEKEFCSRITFDGDFHIDVPAYHEWDDQRLLASKSKGFVDSDPWAIWDWWVSAFDAAERTRARRIVRYLKMWAALKFDPKIESVPSSIMLTVLVAYACAKIELSECTGDDELLAAVVEQIVSHFDSSNSKEVANPVNDDEDLNKLGDDFENFGGASASSRTHADGPLRQKAKPLLRRFGQSLSSISFRFQTTRNWRRVLPKHRARSPLRSYPRSKSRCDCQPVDLIR